MSGLESPPVSLWQSRQGLDHELNQRYAWRTSADGVSDWSPEGGTLTVNGRDHLGTIAVETGVRGEPFSLPARPGHGGGGRLRFVVGYQGGRGRACVARGDDGENFVNLASPDDRRSGGDCLVSAGDAVTDIGLDL